MAEDAGKTAGTDGGNKGGTEDGEKGGASNEQFEQLADGMKALAAGMQTLQESNAKINERMDAVAKSPVDDDDDAGGLNSDDADLEGMSRTDFANSIIDRVAKAVNKQIKEVSNSVEDVRKDSNTKSLEMEVEKLEGKHKDFWDWQPEIRALAKENSGTSVARLYNMAKQENPEKLAELDKKYKKNDGKGGDSSGKKENFGGLMPTSSTMESNDKMDKKSAAEKAFDETMGNVAVGSGD